MGDLHHTGISSLIQIQEIANASASLRQLLRSTNTLLTHHPPPGAGADVSFRSRAPQPRRHHLTLRFTYLFQRDLASSACLDSLALCFIRLISCYVWPPQAPGGIHCILNESSIEDVDLGLGYRFPKYVCIR